MFKCVSGMKDSGKLNVSKMTSRKQKRRGRKSEKGGRISEGKIIKSKFRGYKELARRSRVGGREIDSLLKRGNNVVHFENTMTCITKPKLESLWEKYRNTRIATGANQLAVHSPCFTKPALDFATKKKIRIV